MRIAILSPVWFPVPPDGYGGIELVVSLLADGLVSAGHDVTLFASGDSTTTAHLDAIFNEAPTERIGQTFWELQHAINCFARHNDFDVIHDHTGLLGLALGSLLPTPMVHTIHGPLAGDPGRVYKQIAQLAPRRCFVSLTMAQRRPLPDLPWLANVPNAIDVATYPFEPHDGEYLLFLGRMSPDKGAHRAIRFARGAGMPLKLAGKNAEPGEEKYFNDFVRPHLGGNIEFVGEVPHREKVELLHKARATLFPIDWEEPFGLVMIESMACGTPVIASRRGSVPEVIEDGADGIILDDWNAVGSALERAEQLDPRSMRRSVEERYSPVRLVADYVTAYDGALETETLNHKRPAHGTPCAHGSTSFGKDVALTAPRS